MPNLNIRGIPDDIYEALKHRAEQEERSLNQEVLWLLRQKLLTTAVDERIWRRIDTRRNKLRRYAKAASDSVTLLRKDRGRLT